MSLNIQGNGGGLFASNNPKIVNIGVYIALVGVIFQVVSLVVYACLGAEFFYRYLKDKPFEKKPGDTYYRAALTTRVRWLVGCEITMTVLIIIRSVYRALELAGGPDGTVATTQWLFGAHAHALSNACGQLMFLQSYGTLS